MRFKHKVLIIIGFCFTLSIGSFFIIRFMFFNLEEMLHEKCRIESQIGARVMSDMMEFMISKGVVTEADLMDAKYIEIPNMNPKKYNTRYDRLVEQHIQKIQDEFLKDVDLDFAVLADKNGYVPVHNSKYSKPQTGNYAEDLVKSRSKRIYSDNPSIRKALEYKGNDTYRVFYYRDTGESMWLVSSPVFVRNVKWGYFLQGVSLHRLDIIKNQMTIITVTVMFMILSMSVMVIVVIIPRRILSVAPPADDKNKQQ